MRPLLASAASLLLVTASCGGSSVPSTSNPLGGSETPPASSDPAPSVGYENPPSSVDVGGSVALRFCHSPPADVSACLACVEASCPTDVSAVAAACADVVACVSACDCTNATCLAACAPTLTTACTAAFHTAEANCNAQSCGASCNISVTLQVPIDGGTTQTMGSGIGPTGGGGTCTTLSNCCPNLPAAEISACNSVAQSGSSATCQSTLASLRSAKQCP